MGTSTDLAKLREKAEHYAEVNAGHPSADGQMPMRVADVLALLDEVERQRRINRSAEAYTQDLEKVVDQATKSVTGVLRAIDSFSWHQHDGVFVRATREHAAAAYDELTATVSDIETKVRERDASLIEALADTALDEQVTAERDRLADVIGKVRALPRHSVWEESLQEAWSAVDWNELELTLDPAPGGAQEAEADRLREHAFDVAMESSRLRALLKPILAAWDELGVDERRDTPHGLQAALRYAAKRTLLTPQAPPQDLSERIGQAIAYIEYHWIGTGKPVEGTPGGDIIAILTGERTYRGANEEG